MELSGEPLPYALLEEGGHPQRRWGRCGCSPLPLRPGLSRLQTQTFQPLCLGRLCPDPREAQDRGLPWLLVTFRGGRFYVGRRAHGRMSNHTSSLYPLMPTAQPTTHSPGVTDPPQRPLGAKPPTENLALRPGPSHPEAVEPEGKWEAHLVARARPVGCPDPAG